jgi:hypothetical protein
MTTDSLADKIGPLSVLTTNGVQYIFDPTKVTGVYFVQSATGTSGSSLNEEKPEEKPYVWGISMSLIPIDEDGDAPRPWRTTPARARRSSTTDVCAGFGTSHIEGAFGYSPRDYRQGRHCKSRPADGADLLKTLDASRHGSTVSFR